MDDGDAIVAEIERQIDIWCAATRNISDINKRIALLDAQRSEEEGRIESEALQRRAAERAVQSLVEDIDQDSQIGARVTTLLAVKMAGVVAEEMVS